MSMNLHLQTDNDKYELWQTPTFVTNMCLVNSKGEVNFEVKGKKAKRALHVYLQWVRSSTDGVWESREEHEMAREEVREHVEYVTQALNEKGLTVYQM